MTVGVIHIRDKFVRWNITIEIVVAQHTPYLVCCSLNIGLSVRKNSLIVISAYLQDRRDWLKANVFYSKHYFLWKLDASSRNVTE